VIGAGVGRTGTHSLKLALERLVGGTCHHMLETFGHPEEVAVWHAAAEGTMPDWHEFLAGYTSTVDWPSAAFWPELSEAYPDAVVLLSVRSAESWWKSADNTILNGMRGTAGLPDEWLTMVRSLFASRFCDDYEDAAKMQAAFEANNQRARDTIAPDRLVEWTPSDGWGPICARLGMPVPDEPFPLTNTTGEFRAMMGLAPL